MNHSPNLQLKAWLKRDGFTLDLDLTLPGQGITALFGASGSGKTTALRVLAGLEPSAQGLVCIQGEVWQDSAQGIFKPVHQRALGVVFQEASLFDHLNVQGNVQYGFKRTPTTQRRQNWSDTLELLGITHLLQRWPHELSGGERQRVAIARALASSPRLLLLDEPLAALDASRKADILPYLDRLSSELTLPVIYVSHSLSEVARLADHLVLLKDGCVTAHGPSAMLMTQLDSPLAQGDDAGAVLACRVLSHDPVDHLSLTEFDGGQLTVPLQSYAPGHTLRVRVAARDVSLALQAPTGTSILNMVHAQVQGIAAERPGQVMVSLRAGGSTLLARITQRSAHVLQLQPGLPVVAQIKGVAILG